MKKIQMAVQIGLVAMVVLLWFGDSVSFGAEKEQSQNPHVIINTKFGEIEIELLPDKAPNHVKNFIKLAKSGFYNGTIFHRVIPGFMIQGGDPNTKNQTDKTTYGMGGPGYNVDAEFNDVQHKRGIVSMARANDPNSAGSQFYIVVENSFFLDHQYTVFGKVVKGMGVADKIVYQPRDNRDLPLQRTEMTVTVVGSGDSTLVEKGRDETPTPVAKVSDNVDNPPSLKVSTHKNRHAIVIGIENYREKLPKADYASRDAVAMARYLTKVMGYPEENVVVRTNDKANLTDITKYLEGWLPNNVEKDGTVFIYYSGHGAPNPKTGDAYLVPHDGDPTFLETTGYPLKRLYETLGKLPAKEIIVVLDSCFSGAGGRSVLAKGARPMALVAENSIPGNQKIAVLSASSGSQISSTYEDQNHGLFTYFLLKGLKDAADSNGDRAVDLKELYMYLKPQVEGMARKAYNNEQTPQLIAPAGWLESKRIKLIEVAK